MTQKSPKQIIAQLAKESGFDIVSFADPAIPEQDKKNLQDYLQKDYHGDMDWLASSLPIRFFPDRIFNGAQTAIVLASYYKSEQSEELLKKSRWKITRFAQGKDYHKLLRKKGKLLLKKIQTIYPEIQGRIVCDSAPVMEKVLARQSGLGWMGKHTNIIHPDWGSWFFLSVLFINVKLEPDEAQSNLCRECRLCLDACPTNALEAYQLDATKCLSYITIETKDQKHMDTFQGQREGWIFGCDICQEVCPYNRSPKNRNIQTKDDRFLPRAEIIKFMASDSMQFDNETSAQSHWNKLLENSPLKRAGKERLLKNQQNDKPGS